MLKITKYTISVGVGFILISIGSILFLILGLTVVQVYNNESSFKRTDCTVRDVEIHKMNSKDDWYKCPWKCTINHTPDGLKTYCEISEFPCLRIVVDVATKFGLKSAILHENPEKMQKYYDCSTYYCDQDSVVNDREVNKFKKNYGVIGKKYSCYYNMDSLNSDDYDDDGQEHALLTLTFGIASYVNSLLWPSLCLALGIASMVYGFFNIYRLKRVNKNSSKKRMIHETLYN